MMRNKDLFFISLLILEKEDSTKKNERMNPVNQHGPK